MDDDIGATSASVVPIGKKRPMLTKTVIIGSFLWAVDDNSVFSYGGDDTPTFFTIPTGAWEDMGKPERITITITPGDGLNG